MAEVTVRWLEAGEVRTGSAAALPTARASGWTWVDVLEPDAASLEPLAAEFSLHPLAIEDCLHYPQRPKLDVYPSLLFVVWLAPVDPGTDGIDSTEIDFFIGGDFVVTVHRETSPALDKVAAEGARAMSRGGDWLFHAIVDRLVDETLPIVDTIADSLESIEDAMLEGSGRDQLHQLYARRRQLVQLHRIVGPERDLIRELAREREIIDEEAYRYLQDVGDHLARVQDSIDTYREVAASVMDIYLSSQSNRMNEIMKQLTVVATIFMPLTLISGIYGMNVLKGMWPPFDASWSFAAVVVSMVAIAVAMSAYFRRKNWW